MQALQPRFVTIPITSPELHAHALCMCSNRVCCLRRAGCSQLELTSMFSHAPCFNSTHKPPGPLRAIGHYNPILPSAFLLSGHQQQTGHSGLSDSWPNIAVAASQRESVSCCTAWHDIVAEVLRQILLRRASNAMLKIGKTQSSLLVRSSSPPLSITNVPLFCPHCVLILALLLLIIVTLIFISLVLFPYCCLIVLLATFQHY